MPVYRRDDSDGISIDDSEEPEEQEEDLEYTEEEFSEYSFPEFDYDSNLSNLDDAIDQETEDYTPASSGYDLGDHPIDDPSLSYDPFDPSNYPSASYSQSADNAYWQQFGGKPSDSYDPAIPESFTE